LGGALMLPVGRLVVLRAYPRSELVRIMGFITILQNENLTEAERSEYLNIVWSNGDRLLKTMVDIIDISKIESGQIEVAYSDINLQSVLSSLHDFFKPEAERRQLELVFENKVEPADNLIRSDQMKIYSILTNLIKNALKFTKVGFVKVESSIQGEELCLIVSDSGIGLSEDKLDVIFHRFVQVDTSRTRKFEGSGLGLSISKAYAEILGGSIEVESRVNKGSRFTVRLPLK
jgi:signal transduction histidine kinase